MTNDEYEKLVKIVLISQIIDNVQNGNGQINLAEAFQKVNIIEQNKEMGNFLLLMLNSPLEKFASAIAEWRKSDKK